ncbi:MAG: cysteine desulfurase [Clostridiales bacterium]|nr:cysteine desulfurase [Clostridiales bacterium]
MLAYFDNSATTMPCPQAVEGVKYALENCWGNPSSLHYSGNEANRLLGKCRSNVAKAIGCETDEVLFTSGGTESNNLAVFGAARRMKSLGRRIVSSVAEHPSVYDALTELENEGFEVIRLPIDSSGKVSAQDIFSAVTPDTILVSMMLVNNETGAIMPVEKIKKALARVSSPALVHVDAVQAFGKMNIRPSSIGADLMSVSSHKIHGPKGAGALYIKNGVRLKPLFFGGEQGKKLRPGTEALPALSGFGNAAREAADYRESSAYVKELRDYMLCEFEKIGGIEINSPADALPYVTNVSVPGIKSEPMLNFLSSKGICVSAGSACSKGKKSRVLSEMGLSKERLESPIRVSFSRFTTKEEIDYLVLSLRQARETIYHTK